MSDLKIQKRDGSIENWSEDKIVTSIAKAGVPLNEAETYAAKLKSWAKTNSNNGTLRSTQLRDSVIAEIEASYPAEAENYKVYKQ